MYLSSYQSEYSYSKQANYLLFQLTQYQVRTFSKLTSSQELINQNLLRDTRTEKNISNDTCNHFENMSYLENTTLKKSLFLKLGSQVIKEKKVN